MSTQKVKIFTEDEIEAAKTQVPLTDWYRMSTRLNHLFFGVQTIGAACTVLLRLYPVNLVKSKPSEDVDIIPWDNVELDTNGVYVQIVGPNAPAWGSGFDHHTLWSNVDNVLGVYAQYSLGGIGDSITGIRYLVAHQKINK